MLKNSLFVLVSRLSLAHCWFEFGRRPHDGPVLQRKRIHGFERLQERKVAGKTLNDTGILEE